MTAPNDRDKVRQALALLGVKRLALGIANSSFPSLAEEDIGCGSPYSHGGRAFIRFIHELGFDTLVLAPQGQTRPAQPSPYLASCFSRSLLSLAAMPLCSARVGLISPHHVQRLVAGAPVSHGGAARSRVDFPYGWNGVHGFLEGAFGALEQTTAVFRESFRSFVNTKLTNGSWLSRDSLFYSLTHMHGTEDWRRWPAQVQKLFTETDLKAESQLRRVHALVASCQRLVEGYCFGQFLLQEQHEALHCEAQAIGLALFADTNDSDKASDAPDCWAYGPQLPGYEAREQHLLVGFDGLKKGASTALGSWATATRTRLPLAEQVLVPFELLFGHLCDTDTDDPTIPHWAFRVPANYARSYPATAKQGSSLDLRSALALALKANCPTPSGLALAEQLVVEANL